MEKIVRPIIPKASKLNQMIAKKFYNKNDSLTPIANEIRKLLVDHPDVYADMTALKKLIGNNMMHEMRLMYFNIIRDFICRYAYSYITRANQNNEVSSADDEVNAKVHQIVSKYVQFNSELNMIYLYDPVSYSFDDKPALQLPLDKGMKTAEDMQRGFIVKAVNLISSYIMHQIPNHIIDPILIELYEGLPDTADIDYEKIAERRCISRDDICTMSEHVCRMYQLSALSCMRYSGINMSIVYQLMHDPMIRLSVHNRIISNSSNADDIINIKNVYFVCEVPYSGGYNDTVTVMATDVVQFINYIKDPNYPITKAALHRLSVVNKMITQFTTKAVIIRSFKGK